MQIAEAIKKLPEAISVDSPPIRAKEVLASIYMQAAEFTDRNDALAEAEKRESQFLKKIRALLALKSPFGRIPRFVLNKSSDYMIQGVAFAEVGDQPDLQDVKQCLARITQYRNAFDALTAIQFEGLCAGILELIGVVQARLTPETRDEGIDFYGRLNLEKVLRKQVYFPNVESQLAVWIIGQAKHFAGHKVDTDDIRNLIGSGRLARARAFSTRPETRYLDLLVRPCDPLWYVFFTTGEISNDAWKLLEKTGVVGMDGVQFSSSKESWAHKW